MNIKKFFSSRKEHKKEKVIKNFFKTSNPKKALLSYIKDVFENNNNINQSHTNRLTSYLIAETISNLGYNVDIINWQDSIENEFYEYDFIIGLGPSLEHVLTFRKDKLPKVIWFGTGCNPLFSNRITLQRTTDFYKKATQVLLQSSRYIKEDWPLQHEIADWIILHGSTFAKSTYRDYNIDTIHAPVFINHTVNREKNDWNSGKANYLWFGNGGLIHKGLDLTIDAFKNLSHLNLHICGNIEQESDFYEYYREDLTNRKNIIYHGFVDTQSEEFKNILKTCAFAVFPSASEGNSPSVITCMANGGLIPIVSKNADVDIKDYGIEIESLDEESIIKAINASQEISTAELENRAERIITDCNLYHSFDYFKKDLQIKLLNIL